MANLKTKNRKRTIENKKRIVYFIKKQQIEKEIHDERRIQRKT